MLIERGGQKQAAEGDMVRVTRMGPEADRPSASGWNTAMSMPRALKWTPVLPGKTRLLKI